MRLRLHAELFAGNCSLILLEFDPWLFPPVFYCAFKIGVYSLVKGHYHQALNECISNAVCIPHIHTSCARVYMLTIDVFLLDSLMSVLHPLVPWTKEAGSKREESIHLETETARLHVHSGAHVHLLAKRKGQERSVDAYQPYTWY